MQSIEEVKTLFENCSDESLAELILVYDKDSRKGIQSIIKKSKKKLESKKKELERLETISVYEKECFQKGYHYIAGIDEVGRGPLAGPVVTAAVILPQGCLIQGINDSKKLSAFKRELLFEEICKKAVAYNFGVITSQVIDDINILQATYCAMESAVEKLQQKPDFLLIDALKLKNIKIPQENIIKGDEKSISIGAASILAKVIRDRMMIEYDSLYPEYGFARNKGYGSKEHIEAIKKYGLCPIHRRSFVKNILEIKQ